MNPFSTRIVLLAAGLAGALRAQDSLATLVPADAKFACYIDLQAAIDCIGRDLVQTAIRAHVNDLEGVRLRRDWNERLTKEWGIDPLRDLHGILLFGSELEREEPTVALLTSASIDTALDKLAEMGALERQEHDGAVVEALVPGKMLQAFGVEGQDIDGSAFLHVRRLSGRGPQRAIVFGTSVARLLPAARALGERGRRGESALALAPRAGCIAYLEVADALRSVLGESATSRMASKTKHFSLQLCETGGDIEFVAALQAASSKDARQIAALVNGLKALVSLVEPDADVPEGLLEALNDAHADADGDRVTLEFRLARSIMDEAREAIRAELRGGEREAGEDQPRPGARTKRAIR